jgi:hypothetical protein
MEIYFKCGGASGGIHEECSGLTAPEDNFMHSSGKFV